MPGGAGSILHDAFAGGDYLTAAVQQVDAWQRWAALSLLGRTDAAAELARFDGPEPAFFGAVAHWMTGDDDRALHALDRLPTDGARRLAALIRRRPITVLAQLPSNRSGPWDVLGALRDPAFQIHNISFHRDDIQNRPYADMRALVPDGVVPDFYVTEMLEWHLIPPNVRELGCPIIGHSSDFDLHIQAVAPWLPLFDELVVLDHVEWDLMRGLVDVPVSVCAKVFGVPAAVPPPVEGPRPIDVFLSGTVLHPYHADKEPIVLDLLGLPDRRLRLVNGFDGAERYFHNLGRSKVCCTFVRHPGAMPTRGLEALAAGCVVVVQEESALRLFLDEQHGVIAYGATTGSMAAQIGRVLERWDDFAARAAAGAARVRDQFSLARVASEYLRFLTVLAARPRAPRATPEPSTLIQKRTIVQKGWLPSYKFGGPMLNEWADMSVARLDRQIAEHESPRLLNDRAREVLLAHYHDPRRAASAWLPQVIEPLDRAVRQFPDALVPRVNRIRVLLHFGDADAVTRALEEIDDALGQAPDIWRVDPLDDVLPWDFCPHYFNYRRYFDVVTVVLGGEDGRTGELVDILRAALHHYRGRYHARPDARLADAGEAVRLEPGFAEYGLFYCRLLLERGGPENHRLAALELQRLAGQSLRQFEVLDLASALAPEWHGEWLSPLQERVGVLWRALEMRERLPEPALQSSMESAAVRAARRSAVY